MKRWIGIAVVLFAVTAGWRVGDVLSADALSMAVGLLFGVLAGVPTALLILANGRRQVRNRLPSDYEDYAGFERRVQPRFLPLQFAQTHSFAQPTHRPSAALPTIPPATSPLIMQASNTYPQTTQMPHTMEGNWATSAQPRHFKIVGEQEAWLDEW